MERSLVHSGPAVRYRNGRVFLAAAAVTALVLPAAASAANTVTPPANGTPPSAVAPVAPNQGPTSAAGVAARPDGSNIVVYRGQDTAVYQRIFMNGTWFAESPVGGWIVGAPAVASVGSSVVVAARGLDGGLFIRTFTQGAWGPWENLGGVLSAAPAIAGRPDGRLDVFGRGGDDSLWTRSRPAGGTWSAWASLGGGLSSGPAAVISGSGVEVFADGWDHAVWRRSSAGGSWSAWTSLGGASYSAPAAARYADATYVLVRGRDNAVWVNRSGGGWQSIGGEAIDAPSATGTATGVDLIIRGPDTALFTSRLSGGTWSGFVRAWTPTAPLPPASALFGRDWTTLNTSAMRVALTFDAGGDARGLASIRATLQRYNVPATVFLTGAWTRAFPGEANEVAVAGFRVGNHSDTHPHFPALTDAQVTAELTTAQQAILGTTGQDPRWLFRFPYGEVDGRVLADVNGLKYVAVRWTVDSLGWQGTSGGMSVQKVIDRVLANARPGAIVLLHIGSNPDDGTTLDAAALPQIIAGLRARGYGFVTLDALTG